MKKKMLFTLFAFAICATFAIFTFSPKEALALDPDPEQVEMPVPADVVCYSTYRYKAYNNIWNIHRCSDCKSIKVYEKEDPLTCTP